MAFTIKGGKFSTDDRGNIRQPRPVDEVIDILTDPTGGSGPPSARAMRNVSAVSPQVNVQQLKSLTPTYQGSNVPVGSLETDRDKIIEDALFDNQLRRAMGMEPTTTPYKSFVPAGPIGLQERYNLAGKTPVQGAGPFSLQSLGLRREGDSLRPDSPRGIAGPYEAMDPNMFDQDTGDIFGYMNYINSLDAGQGQAQPQGLGAINPYEQFGDPLLGGDASTILGVNAFDKRAAELLGYDMETMEGVTKYLNDTKRSMENQERDQRLDDERRERAAMLAAQQQQPVDPCPEGYRMDPVSKVCVPVDDTTEPKDPATRTYDTMTRPEPNYTAATGATLPVITLPDILG